MPLQLMLRNCIWMFVWAFVPSSPLQCDHNQIQHDLRALCKSPVLPMSAVWAGRELSCCNDASYEPIFCLEHPSLE